jgi:hypothetical protein
MMVLNYCSLPRSGWLLLARGATRFSTPSFVLACALSAACGAGGGSDATHTSDAGHQQAGQDAGKQGQSGHDASSGDAGGNAGDGDGDGDVGGQPLTSVAASDFCTTMTKLLCAAETACCKDDAHRYADEASCLTGESSDCIQNVQPAAMDPRTGYSPTAAAQALNNLKSKLKSCDLSIGEWFVAQDGLISIYQGTVTSGGSCTPKDMNDKAAVLSCSGGSVCRITPFPLSGQCGAEQGAGGACVTELECQDGLRCNPPQSLGGQCKARLPDDSGCTSNPDCESLLCQNQVCVPRSADTVYCFKGR